MVDKKTAAAGAVGAGVGAIIAGPGGAALGVGAGVAAAKAVDMYRNGGDDESTDE